MKGSLVGHLQLTLILWKLTWNIAFSPSEEKKKRKRLDTEHFLSFLCLLSITNVELKYCFEWNPPQHMQTSRLLCGQLAAIVYLFVIQVCSSEASFNSLTHWEACREFGTLALSLPKAFSTT